MGNGLIDSYEVSICVCRPSCELMIISQVYNYRNTERLTTLPARAVISRSDDKVVSVTFTEASNEAVSSGKSRRHSVARASMIARVMRSDLQKYIQTFEE